MISFLITEGYFNADYNHNHLEYENVYFSEETKYEYDDNDRVVKIEYSDGSSIEYTYDDNGNIVDVKVIEGSKEMSTEAINTDNKDINNSIDNTEVNSEDRTDINNDGNKNGESENNVNSNIDNNQDKNTDNDLNDTSTIEMEEKTDTNNINTEDNHSETNNDIKRKFKFHPLYPIGGVFIIVIAVLVIKKFKSTGKSEVETDENNKQD